MTTTSGFPGALFMGLLGDQMEREQITDGVKVAIRYYYVTEYTDADSLDPKFRDAVEAFLEMSMEDPDEVIQEVQDEITAETGGRRQFVRCFVEDDED